MTTPPLISPASELKTHIFSFCDVKTLLQLTCACRRLHSSVSEELELRCKSDTVEISRDCGLGLEGRPGLEPHHDHNDCRYKNQHPLPVVHELLRRPRVSHYAKTLCINEYGLSRVDGELHDSGLPDHGDAYEISEFLFAPAQQVLTSLETLEQRRFTDPWAEVMIKLRPEETTIVLILIYFLPNLESPTRWSTRR